MSFKNKKITIIHTVYEAKNIENNKLQNPILCMNANVYFYLKKNTNFKLKKFHLSKNNEKKLSIKANKQAIKIYKKLNNEYSLVTREVVKSLLFKYLCSLESIIEIIKNYNEFQIFYKNELLLTKSKNKVIQNFYEKNYNEFLLYRNKINTSIFNSIFQYINDCIFSFYYKNKKVWFFSKRDPAQNLISKIKNNNITYFYFYTNNKYKFLKIINTLFIVFFTSRTWIPILPIIYNNAHEYNKLYDLFKSQISKDLSKYKDIIINNIYPSIIYSSNIEQYVSRILIKHNFKLFITDNLRFKELIGIGSAFKKHKLPVFLISHNTHSLTNTDISNKIQLQNSYGFLNSDLSSKNIIQSRLQYEFYKKYYTLNKVIKSSPIMWGHKKIKNKKNNQPHFTILIADTIKNLYSIPFIYEDSFGYLNNLDTIISNLEYIQNIKIIVRFRPNISLNLDTFKFFMSKYKNVEISTNGEFLDCLNKTDLLISHSSTVIEEAIINNVPICLFSGKNDYFHINKNKYKYLKNLFFIDLKNIKSRLPLIINNCKKIKNFNTNYKHNWNFSFSTFINKINKILN